LAGDGQIGRFDAYGTFQSDRAADAKDADARAGCFHGSAQTAGARIVEIGYLNDTTTAATDGISAKTFGGRKRLDARGGWCTGGKEEQTQRCEQQANDATRKGMGLSHINGLQHGKSCVVCFGLGSV
jgi:hypothetical protein